MQFSGKFGRIIGCRLGNPESLPGVELFILHRDRHKHASYRPQRSWGKVMFLHVSVILFTGGVCWHTTPTPHPQEQTPYRDQCMLGDAGNKQAVRMLLECILVYLSFPKMFSLNSANSVTKIFVITVKGLEPATQPPLVYQDATTVSARHM